MKYVRAIGKAERHKNEIVRVYGAFQDITDETHRNQELKNTRSKYDELYETITSPIVVCSSESNGKFIIKEVNCAGESIFSMKRDELKGKDILDFLPEGDGSFKDLYINVKKTGQPGHMVTYGSANDFFNGIYEINVYMLPCGEIVSLFSKINEDN
ncbi:MAG: hypothetical protein R2741_11460 [Methanolobus sp.]